MSDYEKFRVTHFIDKNLDSHYGTTKSLFLKYSSGYSENFINYSKTTALTLNARVLGCPTRSKRNNTYIF